MLAAMSMLDLGIVALFLTALLAAGVYFSSRQRDSTEFLFAGRSLRSFPLGLSLVGSLVTGQMFLALPAAGYEHGLAAWVAPAAFWLVLPVGVLLVAPLFRGLGVGSPFEYLQLRFDGTVRLAAGLLFLTWRGALLAAIVAWPCRAALSALGWPHVPVWMAIASAGAGATLLALLGGMRAVVFVNVIAALAMLFGAIVVVCAVWLGTEDGPARVAAIADGLGRADFLSPPSSGNELRNTWEALSQWSFTALALLIADQVIVQRLLAAKTVNDARTSCVVATLVLSLVMPILLYAGVCLLSFYHDHPRELRSEWVVNLNGVTREPIRGADGRPLLDESNPGHVISAVTIEQLVAQRRILMPNNKQPFTSTSGLIDPETNRVAVERLAMRRPPRGNFNGEYIVARDAPPQMLPQFAADHLPMGAAGAVVVAILAATLASLVAGIHALTTFVVVEWQRPFGSLRGQSPAATGRSERQSATDELRIARPLTLVVGAALTIAAVLCSQFDHHLPQVFAVTEVIAAPLLAAFLLGMLTRRATGAAVLIALLLGLALAIGWIVVLPPGPGHAWNLAAALAGTLASGYLLSFLVGKRKTNLELRGLVAGCGTLGIRAIDEVTPLIERPNRWQ